MTVTAEPKQVTSAQRRQVAKQRPFRWSGQISAYLFLLPALLIFGIFAWNPIIQTVVFSFQHVKLVGDSSFAGLENFSRMFADPAFGVAWRNSLQFAGISIAMGFFIPIIVAIMVNEMRRAKAFFRLVYFLPTVIPITVSILIWRMIYSGDAGMLNAVLGIFGAKPVSWLQNAGLVKPAIVAMLTWANFGSTLLIYLAALHDVAPEYYEAAEIEGSTPFQRIYYITLPHLRPTMIVTFMLQVIFVVQIFTEPFLLTQGGPGQATITPVLMIYRKAFLNNDFGLASAWSLSLIIVLSLFSAAYLRFSRRMS